MTLRLRLSLATFLLIAAVLGPGTGLTIRWRNEWQRMQSHRVLETELSRLHLKSLDVQEGTLKLLTFEVDTSPNFTDAERKHWSKRLQDAQLLVRIKMMQEISEMRRGCYPQMRTDSE